VRLVQVLANMLNNAARYTQDGGRIALSVEREGDRALIRVRDNGIGIAPEKLSRVFELFVQGSDAARERGAGLGLGLWLVKRLVELHGGSVEAHSDGLGQGAEFRVCLPLASSRRPADPPPRTMPAAAKSQRVLVIDDNVDARESLAQVLRILGHQVRTAVDGASGVAAAQEFGPQLILLDIGLPDVAGYEVARRIRALPDGARPKIVAASGYGEVSDAVRESGMDAYVVKPLDIAKLQSFLAQPRNP
jgi:CheY-like chemotaxis protein